MSENKPGRPYKPIDLEALEALMQFKPTLSEAAHFFRVDEETLAKRIRDNWGLNYSDFRDQRAVTLKMSLQSEAVRRAKKGSNTMLIFALKNMAGWSDNIKATVEQAAPFVLSYRPEDLAKASE
jgi:hypothetical protein